MDNLNVTLDSLSPALFKLFSPTSEKTELKVQADISNSQYDQKSNLKSNSRSGSKKRKESKLSKARFGVQKVFKTKSPKWTKIPLLSKTKQDECDEELDSCNLSSGTIDELSEAIVNTKKMEYD